MATKTKIKVSLKPLDDRIVVRPEQSEERTETGIYLPDSAREKPMRGQVIAAGPGKLNNENERTPLSVKVGDTVVYGKYSGTEVEIEDEELVILHESDLLAKLES